MLIFLYFTSLMSQHKIGFNTAVSVVIANMIGTGVFTSLGFQVMGMSSVFTILLLSPNTRPSFGKGYFFPSSSTVLSFIDFLHMYSP